MTKIVQVLKGHTSPETAYLIEDYPYGFKLRTEKRCWIEEAPKKGFRFASQTRNPKLPSKPWNKVVYSTYNQFGGGMFLDEEGHVQWTGVSGYTSPKEISAFAHTFGATPLLKSLVAYHLKDARRHQAVYAKGESGYTMNGQPRPLRPGQVDENNASIKSLEEILAHWPE